MNNKNNLERIAPIIAMSIAFLLAVIKFIVGLISGSVALLSSAMDSLLDTGVSIFNFFAIKFSKEAPDKEHNYGHGKIEAIAAIFEGTIIILSGLYIIYEAINKIINPKAISYLNRTIVVMLISIIFTGGLVYFLNFVYKKTKNLVIKGDSIHYKTDLYTNLAVILTLIIIYFFPGYVFIDGIVGLLVGLYIIYEAGKLIKEGIGLLLDKALEEHNKVEDILNNYLKKNIINGYHCLKTREGGNTTKFVEFHFILKPETTILKAHDLGEKIEKEIIDIEKDANWHIVWHLDPYDDSKMNGCS